MNKKFSNLYDALKCVLKSNIGQALKKEICGNLCVSGIHIDDEHFLIIDEHNIIT